MNKTLTLLLPLCGLLTACSSMTPSGSSVVTDCPPSPPASDCPRGHEDRGRINIEVTPSQVRVSPPIVCADKGGKVEATVRVARGVPNPESVLVATVPKDSTDRWIGASRTGPGTMEIDVPDSTIVGMQYEYVVMTSTGKCRDPRIHVDQ